MFIAIGLGMMASEITISLPTSLNRDSITQGRSCVKPTVASKRDLQLPHATLLLAGPAGDGHPVLNCDE
jgi:hypothetical protein